MRARMRMVSQASLRLGRILDAIWGRRQYPLNVVELGQGLPRIAGIKVQKVLHAALPDQI